MALLSTRHGRLAISRITHCLQRQNLQYWKWLVHVQTRAGLIPFPAAAIRSVAQLLWLCVSACFVISHGQRVRPPIVVVFGERLRPLHIELENWSRPSATFDVLLPALKLVVVFREFVPSVAKILDCDHQNGLNASVVALIR